MTNEGEHFEFIDTIALGGFGIVNLVSQNDSNFVLKLLKYNLMQIEEQSEEPIEVRLSELIVNEQTVSQKCGIQARVVTLVNNPPNTYCKALLMPHLDGSDLFNYIEELPEPISKKELYEIGMQLFKQLVEFQKMGVIHRDIKPENVMKVRNKYTIIDFGLAVLSELQKGVVGSNYYFSPETAFEGLSTSLSDMWSLAITLLILATRFPIYNGKAQLKSFCGSISTKLDQHFKNNDHNLTDGMIDVLNKILRKHPTDRINAEEALFMWTQETVPEFQTKQKKQRLA